jgi:Protein of unknown function (DUF1631)
LPIALTRCAVLSTESTFVRGVREIIREITNEFREDLELIRIGADRLEELYPKCRIAVNKSIDSAATVLEQQERDELARLAVLAEIKRRISPRTPAFIRDFLTNWWVHAVQDAQRNYDASDPNADSEAHRLEVVDGLVWSVTFKASAEVKQLATVLPRLMRSIVRGMAVTTMPQAEREAFFAALMSAHTETITAAKSGGDPAEMQPVLVLPEDQKGADHGVDAPPSDAFDAIVANLALGTTVEMGQGSKRQRLKLSWVSPARRTFVLSSHGSPAKSVRASSLAEAFRRGKIHIVTPDEPLLDRSVKKIVQVNVSESAQAR